MLSDVAGDSAGAKATIEDRYPVSEVGDEESAVGL